MQNYMEDSREWQSQTLRIISGERSTPTSVEAMSRNSGPHSPVPHPASKRVANFGMDRSSITAFTFSWSRDGAWYPSPSTRAWSKVLAYSSKRLLTYAADAVVVEGSETRADSACLASSLFGLCFKAVLKASAAVFDPALRPGGRAERAWPSR
jgi:hypothetical protein